MTESNDKVIPLEDIPAYIEGLTSLVESLQGQIKLRNGDLNKALARIAELEEKYAKKARLLAESAFIAERLTDERDAARKQTAELVEAVERYNRCPLDAHDRPESWDAIADIQAAAAQLKEQDYE